MILVLGLLITLACAAVAAGALNSFVLSRWEAPGTESVRAQEVLARDFATGNANLVLLVESSSTVDGPEVRAAAGRVEARLAGEERVADVWSYWSRGGDPTMRSPDGHFAVILAHVEGDATTARAWIRGHVLPSYTADRGPIAVRVGGGEAVSSQVSERAASDFLRAEALIVPLMLALLIFLYRRVRLALLTLGVGLFSVFTTLALLRVVARFTEVSTFAANITLVMGVGLGIDYGLFMIARFREELTRGATAGEATAITVRTAGRTVVFSGLTVAASLSALFVFPFPFLRSFAYAGVLVVVMAVLGALTVLPAALGVLGPRTLRRNPPPVNHHGFWYRLGTRVMRRPVLFAAAGLVLVGVLGAPALGLRIGLPDDRVLPPTASTRQTSDLLRATIPYEPSDALQVIVPAGDSAPLATALSRVPGIAQVNAPTGVYAAGARQQPFADPAALISPSTVRLEAVPTRAALAGTDVPELVEHVRALAPEAIVGGFPAELSDFRAALTSRIPIVAAMILAISFAVLFAMARSLLIPLKATVLNLLSLTVMFGVLVTVFQNGAFANVLGFTPIGTLDPAFPILMFCVAYGLSMDYEVFLLSRIKERYDRTGDNTRSVLEGLQRSAPLVTAAAAILAVSFSLYATGEVMYLQMIGVGTAVAIVVDAKIIRGVLVPSLMRLAGRANWWAPSFRWQS
ncbi:MMPL family transporter [Paractinoplanes abujensis]|uniref:RND superfamily putative drug exporter n=1 Tax=Paractinoplanes abujensis TaxID=882441 RepID=A0A7W7G1Z3_9ACTN|nr:MMPL family transporter [Actinoplanes abujensis]MBB4691121.1 RND superfamily putative drug exporter [Actinoplanes abujensis]